LFHLLLSKHHSFFFCCYFPSHLVDSPSFSVLQTISRFIQQKNGILVLFWSLSVQSPKTIPPSVAASFPSFKQGEDSAAGKKVRSPAMAAALECWSGRPSTDEETVEHVLMKPHGRSDDSLPTCADSARAAGEPTPAPAPAPAPPKKWQRLGRNFAGAIAAFKNTLSLDGGGGGGGLPRDPSPRAEKPPPLLLRGLAQLYSRGAANQQLPEKLVADLRRHFDALPNRSVSQSRHLFAYFFPLMPLPNSATKARCILVNRLFSSLGEILQFL
jgi:hypothetical protein